jgi:hypothetical protein
MIEVNGTKVSKIANRVILQRISLDFRSWRRERPLHLRVTASNLPKLALKKNTFSDWRVLLCPAMCWIIQVGGMGQSMGRYGAHTA